MPRTIEHIVETHRAAHALRSAGKKIWNQTIDIKAILKESDDTSIEHICDVAVRVAKLIRNKVSADTFDYKSDKYDQNLEEAIEDLESYEVSSLRELQEKEGLNILKMLNGRIDEIYDWADGERIWMG